MPKEHAGDRGVALRGSVRVPLLCQQCAVRAVSTVSVKTLLTEQWHTVNGGAALRGRRGTAIAARKTPSDQGVGRYSVD